jgi:hypothetical protein
MTDGGPTLTRRGFLGAAAIASATVLARGTTAAKPDETDELFAKPRLLDVALSLTDAARTSLRERPREWVDARVTVDGRAFERMPVHLKGTTSFKPLDAKPSFTLGIDKGAKGRRLFGLRKLHLNNSTQDRTYACDAIAGELFTLAGVPRARTAWARVRLDDRALGAYVVKEGVDADFLARHFPRTNGNFYDGGLHHDVFSALVLDSGDGPRNRSDLKALHDASLTPDPAARWAALGRLLDLPRFISMTATEALTCHVDGYGMMQNNFRIYFEPPSGRAVFVAHGLDRMFKEPEDPLEPKFRGIVTKAVLGVPQGRDAYRARLAELAHRDFLADRLAARVDEIIALIGPSDEEAVPRAKALRERLVARAAFVRRKLAEG